MAGRVEYTCPAGDPQDPVTFTTRDSYLTLPSWEVTKQGIISFKFRTNEPNGLLILNTGIKDQKVCEANILFKIKIKGFDAHENFRPTFSLLNC